MYKTAPRIGNKKTKPFKEPWAKCVFGRKPIDEYEAKFDGQRQ